MPGLHTHEYIRSSSAEMGGRSKLVVHGSCHQVRQLPLDILGRFKMMGWTRIATDLNLHQVSTAKPQSEKQEREILNRTRVWMICFNLDRSTATQFGKPSTIKED